jgi:hypothetical protein
VDWNLDNNSQTEHAHLKAREMVVSSDGNLLLTSDNNRTLSVWTTGHFRSVYELAYVCTCPKISFGYFCILYENHIGFVIWVVVVKQIEEFVRDLCGETHK